MKLETALLYLLALPRSIVFNFIHLPFSQAVRFPVLISHRVHIRRLTGHIKLNGTPQSASIQFGFGHVRNFNWRHSRTVLDVIGKIEFEGRVKFGYGTKLVVIGEIFVGNNFNVTAETEIVCKHKIKFGSNNLASWGTLLIDHDYHKIYDVKSSDMLNAPRPIIIGNDVWIGCRYLVLKGTVIGDGCIIGAGSVVNKNILGEQLLLDGSPARMLREGVRWEQ